MRLSRLAGYFNLLIAGALLLVAWGLLTLLASRPALKHLFDLTPQARATVDPVTKELLAQVRQQELKISFHLFFNPLYSPPQDEYKKAEWEITATLQALTRDLLRQYAYLGGDAVSVKDYDPDTEIQETRLAKQGFSISSNADTIVVAIGGRHKKLSLQLDLGDIDLPSMGQTPGIAAKPVSTLRGFRGEEALSSAIKSLLVTGTPIIYFLSGYGSQAHLDGVAGGDYKALQEALVREGFEVRDLPLKAKGAVPDDATALALLEPQIDFTEHEVDLLLNYLKKGGRLFINYGWHPLPDHDPTGEYLGRRLGFELTHDLVFQRVATATGGRMDGNSQVTMLICGYNRLHPLTAPLSVANGRLSLQLGREFLSRSDMPKGVRRDWIVSTDVDAWTARTRVDATGRPLFDYNAPDLPGALAPRDVGIVVDVDGDQKGITGHAVLLAGLAFNNLGWSYNRDLALNIFNWMVDRKVLVPVAGDRYRARHVQIGKDQVDNIWWLLVVFVPGLFLLLGLLVSWRRSLWR